MVCVSYRLVFHGMYCLYGIGRTEHGATGYQHIRTGAEQLRRILGIHAAIDLDERLQSAALNLLADEADLAHGLGNELLATKTCYFL